MLSVNVNTLEYQMKRLYNVAEQLEEQSSNMGRYSHYLEDMKLTDTSAMTIEDVVFQNKMDLENTSYDIHSVIATLYQIISIYSDCENEIVKQIDQMIDAHKNTNDITVGSRNCNNSVVSKIIPNSNMISDSWLQQIVYMWRLSI